MSEIEDVFRSYGVQHATNHHHSREGWVQFDCPFCGRGSGKFHMGYRISGAYVNCWRCGRHDLYETLKELLDVSYPVLKEIIDDLRSRTSSVPRSESRTHRRRELLIPKEVGPMLRVHRDYLRARGFNPRKTARLWGLQGIGLARRLAWRIFIPIHSGGRLVSWTTRAIGKTKARYITCPAEYELIDHRTILFGEDYCRDSVVVVEGLFDAMRIGPGAVAALGTNISADQIMKLAKYPSRCICFDNEPQAQRKARRVAEQLSVFPGRTVVVCLDAKDAAEASEREIRQLRKEFLS